MHQSDLGVVSSRFPAASSPMTRRPPTSSPSLWSAIRCATWAWWRTSAWGERATPSARPTSPAWNATKCSANGPGPTGEDLPGNGCVYAEAVANCRAGGGSREGVCFVTGSLPNKSLWGFCEEKVRVESEKRSQVSLTKAPNLRLLPAERLWPALIDCSRSGQVPGEAVLSYENVMQVIVGKGLKWLSLGEQWFKGGK